MSTNTLVIPDNIKAMLAKSSVASVDAMESGASSVPRISLRKSKFTGKVNDEELKLGETIDVVILGIEPGHGFNKTFYKDTYQPGSTDPPDCSSTDGVKPDGFVSNPQNNLCATCPQNQWGSATSTSGKKSKACKDSKRLYVKLAEELADPSKPTYLLNVTVMSLKPFSEYGKNLTRQGIPTPSIVITRLSFNEAATVPQLVFTLVGLLDDTHCQKAIEFADAKEWSYAPAESNDKQALPTAAPSSTAVQTTSLDNW